MQILVAKSPLAPFTSFVYTIKKEGLVLQGKILGLSRFFKLILLSAAHWLLIIAMFLIEATSGQNKGPKELASDIYPDEVKDIGSCGKKVVVGLRENYRIS